MYIINKNTDHSKNSTFQKLMLVKPIVNHIFVVCTQILQLKSQCLQLNSLFYVIMIKLAIMVDLSYFFTISLEKSEKEKVCDINYKFGGTINPYIGLKLCL